MCVCVCFFHIEMYRQPAFIELITLFLIACNLDGLFVCFCIITVVQFVANTLS